ncbi:hypothetical protein QIG78_26465, partial [Klebsiella pneumoniae]|nr:hypothetical protein [Klebsiella pneumoniae]
GHRRSANDVRRALFSMDRREDPKRTVTREIVDFEFFSQFEPAGPEGDGSPGASKKASEPYSHKMDYGT